ncbi:MAG: SDR family oxidoreductase [Planctomycetota bacterium]|jgi:short-subunit dehydrogenase
MKGCVLVLGATKGIGRELARELARRGHALIVAGRDAAALETLVSDLRVRHGVEAVAKIFDARDVDRLDGFFFECVRDAIGPLDGVVVNHGYAGSNDRARTDWMEARAIVDTNYVSAVRLLNLAAAHFEEAGRGFICGVSSVAGDRGRGQNYIYGSAKAGLSAYLQGLRNRLAGRGVAVITVKPGYIDTAMTYGHNRVFLAAPPQRAARDICRAIERRKDVVYTPWFWRWIMLVIRLVPERIFKRLDL